MKYILIFAFLYSILQSAPARSGERTFEQENGVIFKGQARGDQHLHWIESEDGEILKYNPATKNYEIAKIQDENLVPSGIKYSAGIKKARSINMDRLQKEELFKLWSIKQQKHRLRMESKH